MVPQELKRDTAGLDRVERIERADRDLARARFMGAAWTADPDRGFEKFADEDCELCESPRECGMNRYRDLVIDAAAGYSNAGLGKLASRVDAIHRSPPTKAWAVFDESNRDDEL